MANARVLWLGGLTGAIFCFFSQAQEPKQPAPAGDASPTPETTVSPEPSAVPLVTPVPTPENGAPDLLPESHALPTPTGTPPPSPRDLIPNGAVPQALLPPNNAQSALQRLQDVRRFRDIRTLAERDPYAVWLRQYA